MSLTASVSTWFRQRWQPLSLGERGEKQAARFLHRLGYKILFTRHRSRYGEFDILAVDGQTVVFVEVKTRRNTSDDRPAEAVDAHRQARLTRAALAFLKAHRLLEYPSRFDVIEVHWPKLEKRPAIQHLRNAFPPASHNQLFS